MNGLWDILSVAIGVSFIFMILSILNSWIQDYIATLFNIRANNLADIMQNLLEPGALKLKGKDKAKNRPPEIITKQSRRPSTYKTESDNETLNSIAADHQVTAADLRNANVKTLDGLLLPKDGEITIPEHSYTVRSRGTMDNIVETVKETINLRKTGVDDSTGKPPKPDEKIISLASIAELQRIPIGKLQSENILSIFDDFKLRLGFDVKFPNSKTGDKVKANETKTISSIAKDRKLDIAELRKANSKSLIELPLPEGTRLTIPEYSYIVQAKETLNSIAERLNIAIEDLRHENPDIFNKIPLPYGTELKLPEMKEGYIVHANDSVSSIAEDFGVSILDLQNENKDLKTVPDPYKSFKDQDLKLWVGKTIEIPRPEIGQMESRENMLKQLLANPVGSLYSHPIINSLSKPDELPDRIPTNDFTVALLDILDDIGRKNGKASDSKINIKYIIEGITNLEKQGKKAQHPLAFRLRSLLYTAQINTQIADGKSGEEASLAEFQKVVSKWFDDTLARGSLWYKRKMQRIGILIGILLAIVLNADTIGISNALWHNAVLRESISQAAEASAQQGQPTGEQAQQQLEDLMNIGLPIGWAFDGDPDNPRAVPTDLGGWVSKSIGLLLTGFAISQGSQIWFDLMNRLLNLRSGGADSHPDESKEKEKK